MAEYDRLAVEEDLLVRRERLGRLRADGEVLHAEQRTLVRDDAGAGDAQAEVAGRVAAQPAADLRERLVAADVVGVDGRVDDDPNRLVGDRAERLENVVRRAA